MATVLVAGVYLAERRNCAAHAMFELASAVHHRVTQRWAALTAGDPERANLPWTVRVVKAPAPKFSIVNELVAELAGFNWAILCDDDVELPPGFLDDFLKLAERFDFALCQPARTQDSFIDHAFVRRAPGLLARRTRFVEIGPLTCIRREAFPLIFPFDELVGMGWGLDFIWPVRIERAGLRMGIVDAVPVAHRMRKPVRNYSHSVAERQMQQLLSMHEHLGEAEAFTVLEAYT
jgi:hypothetical protein